MNITSHGTALKLVMWSEIIGSLKESGEQMIKINVQLSINRRK